MKLAHFGDLGHPLTDEQAAQIGNVDVALIPVGGFYTIDPHTAKQVARQVNAKVIIPMHYRTEQFGFDVIAHIDDFTALYDNVIATDGCTAHITTAENSQPAVLVLTPMALEK